MREPVGSYPPSTEAMREWFRRTYGREASDLEIGDLERRLAARQEGVDAAAAGTQQTKD